MMPMQATVDLVEQHPAATRHPAAMLAWVTLRLATPATSFLSLVPTRVALELGSAVWMVLKTAVSFSQVLSTF